MESYDATKLLRTFHNLILSSVSFHCFFAHVELEEERFAAWNQVPWPCKGRSKTTTGYMEALSNQEEKNTLKIVPALYPLTFLKPQPVSLL